MAARSVLALHDDGRWCPAELLDPYRDRVDGAWLVVVTYSTEPGSRYMRAEPAERCRAVDDPPPSWTDPRQDGRTPALHVTPAGTPTRADRPPW